MRKSSLFLLELLAMVLVFSLCATVCVRLVAASWRMSQESEQLTQAVYLAETMAAHIQSGNPRPVEETGALELRTERLTCEVALVVTRIYVECEGNVIFFLDVTTEEVAS